MRTLLFSILIALTGCTSLSPEERAQRQEDRQYQWQEACIAFLQAKRECNAIGGHLETTVHIPWHRDCPRHPIDMRMATCRRGGP